MKLPNWLWNLLYQDGYTIRDDDAANPQCARFGHPLGILDVGKPGVYGYGCKRRCWVDEFPEDPDDT